MSSFWADRQVFGQEDSLENPLGYTMALGIGGDEMEISRQEIKFFASLAGIAAVGVLLILATHYFPEALIVRRLLATAVGEALVVAAVLGLTVDLYIKQYLIRRASQDVYKYLVGYNLPNEIKARIQALMGTSLIRRNWHIAYTLTPVEGVKDEVLIDVRYTFELENVTNTVQHYTHRVQVEKYQDPRVVELRCDDPESKFRLVAKPGESLGKDQEGEPGIIEAHGPTIDVQSSGGSSGQRYPFTGHYQLRTPSNKGDQFSFAHPSIGVTITASYPKEYKMRVESSPDMVVTEDMWQFRNRAFLTSEHVMVRWFKV